MPLAATLLFWASIVGASTMLAIDGYWYGIFGLWAIASFILALVYEGRDRH